MSVLIATNGSAQSEAALQLGAQIAAQGRASLTILTVSRDQADRSQASVDEVLARARRVVDPQVAAVRTVVRTGHPATEIVREAEEGSCALVVVGQRAGRNLVTRFRFGSTAIRVVEHAPCPVIVAKGRIQPTRRILLCDSGGRDLHAGLSAPLNRSAAPVRIRSGRSVVNRFMDLRADLLAENSELVVLHVMSQMSAGPGVKGRQLRSEAEELISQRTPEGELLRRDIRALEALGIHAWPKVRHGLVVEEILDEVQTGDYDMVAIGAYRGEGWQRILLDDLTHRLVVELDRPVLVLR